MKVFVVLACFFISGQAASLLHDVPCKTWDEWKHEHGKNYSDTVEHKIRMANYLDNVAIIKAHNEMAGRGETSYTMGTNEFSDLVSNSRNNYNVDIVYFLNSAISKMLKRKIILFVYFRPARSSSVC